MSLFKTKHSHCLGSTVVLVILFIIGLLGATIVGGVIAYRVFRQPTVFDPAQPESSAPLSPESEAALLSPTTSPAVSTSQPEASETSQTLDQQLDLLLEEMKRDQEAPMQTTPTPDNPLLAAVRNAFEFTCAARDYPVSPAVELILLRDQSPVMLKAALRQVGPLPDGYSIRSTQVLWSADRGSLVPSVVIPQANGGSSPLSDSTATLAPGDQAEMITVRAEIEIVIAGEGTEADSAQPVRLVAELRLLPPYSSIHLADGLIEGYSVGHYLDTADSAELAKYNVKVDWYAKYPDIYRRPDFFYKVTPQTRDLLIAPNQPLAMHTIDFPWKSLGMPQYIALDLNLVQKLEDLIALMRGDGFAISRFVTIYGFRPPVFNLGTIEDSPDSTLKEPFSMHQYGRAIDLIIDENGDGVLDDLNGDGVSDMYDAAVIMHYVNILDRQYREEGRIEMVGGAGLYSRNDFVERTEYLGLQSSYIHIDTRGFLTERGTLVRWPSSWPNGDWIQFGQI